MPSLVGNKAEMDSHTLLWPLEATQPSTSHTSLRVRPSSKVLGIQSRPGPRHFGTDSPAGESLSYAQTYWMVLCKTCTCESLVRGSPLTLELWPFVSRGTLPAPVKHFLNPCLHHSTFKPCPLKLWVLRTAGGPMCVSVCLCVYVWVCVCRAGWAWGFPLHPKFCILTPTSLWILHLKKSIDKRILLFFKYIYIYLRVAGSQNEIKTLTISG